MSKVVFNYSGAYHDYYECGVNVKILVERISKEVVYIKSVNTCTGAVTDYRVFDNSTGETLSDEYIYFVKVVGTNGNILVDENTRIYCVEETPNDKVYGICGATKCKIEVVAKSDIAIITTNANSAVSYPEGFKAANCVVLSVMQRSDDIHFRGWTACNDVCVYLGSGDIKLTTTDTLNKDIQIVLYKI